MGKEIFRGIKMKLFSYIDDGLNWLIINVFEKLPDWINISILVLLLTIIISLFPKKEK